MAGKCDRMNRLGRGKNWGRPLGDWVGGCIAPALARYGFGEADIVTAWLDIVGERVASFAEPIAIKWPRGLAKGLVGTDAAGKAAPEHHAATLVLRVEGVFALELQHLAPMLIERINAHLGWRCIGKLAMRQAPLQGRPPSKRAPTPPSPAAIEKACGLVAGIEDDALRMALVRLGSRALKPP